MKKIIAVILVLLILQPQMVDFAHAAPNLHEHIRIGLVAQNYERSRINIGSAAIEIGYSIGNFFQPAAGIFAQAGFAIVPINDPFTLLPQHFPNFAMAYSAALGHFGAVPVLVNYGIWGIALPGGNGSNRRVALIDGARIVMIAENTGAMLQIRGTNGETALGDRRYRGVIEFGRFSGAGVTAVNVICIEEYLMAVVPAEMPAGWEMHALKAQAVAARTYTVHRRGAFAARGFDLCDTESSQVYIGITREHERTTAAVLATRGRLILHRGQPIEAVYFSSSGGFTEYSQNVWFESRPYLRAVADIYETDARVWERSFTLTQFGYLLSRVNVNIGVVQYVTIVSAANGRVQLMTFNGSNGQHNLQREAIRQFFGPLGGWLYSRNFGISGSPYQHIPPHTMPPHQQSPPIIDDGFFVASHLGVTPAAPSQLRGINSVGFQNYLPTTAAIIAGNGQVAFRNTVGQQWGLALPLFSLIPVVGAETTASSSGYTVTFSGRGWGHGVGMSQHGANAMARAGYTYEQILRHFYTGVEIR
ncbi:MAG: SpoIID/LytB domain-containing protein [Defluviitaleaceae bacterium]|nr:SpoIID/LytB domain-containing protein [Defluviitaleaceae bacterium]